MPTSNPNNLPTPVRPQSAAIVGFVPSPRPSVLSATPDALTLLRALRRRWVLALGLGLLLAGTIGPAAWYLTPKAKYTAHATLYVATKPKRIVFPTPEGLVDPQIYQRTQVVLLTDRYVLAHALGKPEVSRLPTIREQLEQRIDPEERLEEQLQAQFPGGSEVLEVSLSGDRPDDLATIVNAVIDSYMILIVDEERKEQLHRLEKLKELWDKYQQELKLKRKSLEELAASVGSHDQMTVAMAQQFKTEQLHMAQGEQMRTRSELLQVQAELEALEATPDARPAPTAPATALTGDQLDRHPRIINAKAQMDELARRYRQINQIARKTNDPALQAVRRQWEAARAELDRLRAGVVAELSIGPRGESSGERALERTRLRARLQILKGYQAALAEDISQLQKAIQEINHGGLDLEAERAEISIAAEFAERVGKEKEYLEVEIGAPDRIRVLAAAKPPRTKDESRKIKAGGVAALGSFVLALLGVSFWEFRARRIDAADEVVTGLGLKLVGALPALPGRTLHRSNASGSLPSRRWQSLLVESIDATRTMLLHASRAEAVRVVMITSAVKGEGKTSVSCHLAASLARAGRSTLLIDCDLRRPAIHRLFDQPVGPGLCELLRGEAGPGEVIRPTAADLSLITAGGCDALALQALAQDGLRTIFAELKNQYDFIIVDSAPVLSVADSLLAGQSVDGVIFSVLRDVSRLPEVHAAYERLAVLGAKMLGVIVSGVHGTVYNSEHYTVSSSSR